MDRKKTLIALGVGWFIVISLTIIAYSGSSEITGNVVQEVKPFSGPTTISLIIGALLIVVLTLTLIGHYKKT